MQIFELKQLNVLITFLHSPDVLLFSAGSFVSLYNIRGSKCDLEIIIFYCNEVSIQYITGKHSTEQYILAQSSIAQYNKV